MKKQRKSGKRSSKNAEKLMLFTEWVDRHMRIPNMSGFQFTPTLKLVTKAM